MLKYRVENDFQISRYTGKLKHLTTVLGVNTRELRKDPEE
jgi:hypothetical protein